ncbi:hypothetical protein TWF481_008368 [Arthrobotrys musiformis]|uniref:Uncharacterized protein n=1 Tax=Arthrobotrys musiformis TaxID=47236 RepID=A0AAV9W7Z5_9PEZI
MGLSKVLTALVVCILYLGASVHAGAGGNLDKEKREMRALLARWAGPRVNPALQYYNITGRDAMGRWKGADDSNELRKKYGFNPIDYERLNITEAGMPELINLIKRHSGGGVSVHKETIYAVVGWRGYTQKFLEFVKFLKTEVEPAVTRGKVEATPGCRPVWASCQPGPGATYTGEEYLELCNFGTETQIIDMADIFARFWAMMIGKIWEAASTWRYAELRLSLHIEEQQWSGNHEAHVDYPFIGALSKQILMYSWPSNEVNIGVGFYRDRRLVEKPDEIKKVFKLDCGRFAEYGR